MQAEFIYNNGDKVKDRISGLEGVIISRSDNLFGCNRYWAQPQAHKDGKPEQGTWFDEDQLVLVEAAAITPKRYRVVAHAPDAAPHQRAGGPSDQPPSETRTSTR